MCAYVCARMLLPAYVAGRVQVVTRTKLVLFGRDCGGVRIRTYKKEL